MNNRFFYGIWIITFMSLVASISFAQEILTEAQAKQMALDFFQKEVSDEIKSEYRLVFAGRVEYVQGDDSTYKVFWQRYVNNIVVPYDGFYFVIYLRNGEIISKELKYSIPASKIDMIPTLSKDQAKWVLSQNYKGAEITGISPQIINGKLVYLATLEGRGGIAEVTVDADTGEITFLGGSTGDGFEATPVKFDPTAYYLETYGTYVLLGLIALGGLFYYKRDLFSHKRK